MKKILTLLLALVMTFTLTACENKDASKELEDSVSSSQKQIEKQLTTTTSDATTTSPVSTTTLAGTNAVTKIAPPTSTNISTTTPTDVKQLPTDIIIISSNEKWTNTSIYGDVYVTKNGKLTLENVTIIGKVYVHGRLNSSEKSKIDELFGYQYGRMYTCPSFDGTHGLISGSLSIASLTIADDALDDVFNKYGKQ